MDFLKTNVERTLDRIGVKARDENGEIRSEDELTADVMAFLDKCSPEYANKILFEIEIAGTVDGAAGQAEAKYWGGK